MKISKTNKTTKEKVFYKIRKFFGLTLFEDAIADITEEDRKNFKPQKTNDVDWVTPSAFTGI